MTPCRQEQKSESYRFRQPVPSLPHEKQQQEPTPLKTPLRAAAPQKFLIPPGPPDPCSRPPPGPLLLWLPHLWPPPLCSAY